MPKSSIQLKPGYDSLYPHRPFWNAAPIGENRLLPRTLYPATVTVGNYTVDLQTGEAKIACSASLASTGSL